jgi:membrane protein implicated in regulation of membrane protease activity
MERGDMFLVYVGCALVAVAIVRLIPMLYIQSRIFLLIILIAFLIGYLGLNQNQRQKTM